MRHMRTIRERTMVGGAALAVLGLAMSLPLGSAQGRLQRRAVSASSVTLTGFGLASPAAANPQRAAVLAKGGLNDDFGRGTFRFTPSGQKGKRAVTVAVRARVAGQEDAQRVASIAPQLTPSAYNLGVAVGWKRFALSGDLAKVDNSLLPINHEAAELGISYQGNRWNTRVEVGADRALGLRSRVAGADETYSVGVGGSYALTGNLAVTGGLRYRMDRDRLNLPNIADDQRRDSQAVYIGTAFRF